MKRPILIIMAVIALLFATGCQTVERGPTILEDMAEHGRWYVVAREAAFEGSSAYLQEAPYRLNRFERVEGHLSLILAADRIDMDLIVRTLSQLPIRELESDNARFWLEQGNLLARMAGDPGIAAEDLPLREIVQGIRDGINMAVSARYAQ